MSITCRVCGHENDDERTMCLECGNKLNKPEPKGPPLFQKPCIYCGTLMPVTYQLCPNCNRSQTQSKHNKMTAGLLALFLGGIGAHKFYLGQNGAGIMYILLSWTFIPSVIGFIEGIMFLTMSDDAFAQKYG